MYTLIKKNIIPIMVVVAIILIITKSYIRNVLTSLYYNKENFNSDTENKNENKEWFMENDIKGGGLLGYGNQVDKCRYRFSTLDEAKIACNKNKECTMITMDEGECHPNKKYELLKGGTQSYKGAKTWFKPTDNIASTTKPTIEYFKSTSAETVGVINKANSESAEKAATAALTAAAGAAADAQKSTLEQNEDIDKQKEPLSGNGTKAITNMINTFTPFLEKLMDKNLKKKSSNINKQTANTNSIILVQLQNFFKKREEQNKKRNYLLLTENNSAKKRHSNHAIDKMLRKQTKVLRKIQKDQASLTKQYKNKKKELTKNSVVIDNTYILKSKVPACAPPINMQYYTLKSNIKPIQ